MAAPPLALLPPPSTSLSGKLLLLLPLPLVPPLASVELLLDNGCITHSSVPTATRCPATVAVTPLPGSWVKLPGTASYRSVLPSLLERAAAAAAPTIALATGCTLLRSTAAARARISPALLHAAVVLLLSEGHAGPLVVLLLLLLLLLLPLPLLPLPLPPPPLLLLPASEAKGTGLTLTTLGFPSVSVPVLSNTTVST